MSRILYKWQNGIPYCRTGRCIMFFANANGKDGNDKRQETASRRGRSKQRAAKQAGRAEAESGGQQADPASGGARVGRAATRKPGKPGRRSPGKATAGSPEQATKAKSPGRRSADGAKDHFRIPHLERAADPPPDVPKDHSPLGLREVVAVGAHERHRLIRGPPPSLKD